MLAPKHAGCVIIRMPLSASAHARLSQQRSEQLAACIAIYVQMALEQRKPQGRQIRTKNPLFPSLPRVIIAQIFQ